MTNGLEKLAVVVDQNELERVLSALLLRALAVGRQQAESIEAARDLYGVKRFYEPF